MAPKALKKPAATKGAAKRPAAAGRSRSPRASSMPLELRGTKAFIVNLERRPDRWRRVAKMLKKETPWLDFERFKASDGTQNPIPEAEVADVWNTHRNAHFADYYEWVYDMPGSPLDGTQWKWACDAKPEDDEWTFTEHGDEWSYIKHAGDDVTRTGTIEKIASKETFKVRLQFAKQYLEPGQVQRMSGGERGCAHSHLRIWRVAAERSGNTLVLEDDVHLCFDRSSGLGKANGKVFTERLRLAVRHAPADFDVIYLGWSGWRGGHYRHWKQDGEGQVPESSAFIRKAEYVWTTVAYVISQAGAKKLLAAGLPINQPVDNFMAWEASQGRLNSYVVLDKGDDDDTWAGGIVDQFDFQGDSDIKKSDGGHQGDDEKEFAVDP